MASIGDLFVFLWEMNEMQQIAVETHPFEPFLPEKSRVLMLGTFPPKPQRWSMEFYYPNKINDMWRIMGLIFYGEKNEFWNESEKKFRLDEIKRFLSEKKIALYDTGRRIRRLKDNASDKFLEIVEPVDIKSMLDENPTIEAIFTTGEKATGVIAEIFGSEIPSVGGGVTLWLGDRKVWHYRLPSSSRAYPLSLEKKAAAYSQIFQALGYEVFEKNA